MVKTLPHRDSVFICYARQDIKWLELLTKYLQPYLRESQMDIWSDQRIQAGDDWRSSLLEALERSKLAILLVTSDFLASNFIISNELPRLLEKAQDGGLKLLWIALKASGVKETPIYKYQALNDPAVPLIKRSSANRDQELDRISYKIRDICQTQRFTKKTPSVDDASIPKKFAIPEWNAEHLSGVRRAYRLIHDFQRKMFSTISVIAQQLQSVGLEFKQWGPYNFPHLPAKNVEFYKESICSAWQFLPVYGIECIWERRIANIKDARRVVLELLPDDGWPNPSPDDLLYPNPETFPQAELTKSMLYFSLYSSNDVNIDFHAAWRRIQRERRPNLYNGDDHTFVFGSAKCLYRYFELDISGLGDQASIKTWILEPLSAWMGNAFAEGPLD